MAITRPNIDYEALIKEDRVHSSIFTSPEIFEEEMDKIFHRGWLYVGHASEVPESGDYVTRWMGRVPVLMTRDEDGEVHLLVNRCRHWGVSICQFEAGNSMFFRCWNHGWTYENTGRNVAISFPHGYTEDFFKENHNLTPVPRMGIYRGFVFASLSPTGISLDEHLGEPCKREIDLFCDGSPEGEVVVRGGFFKARYAGNYKLTGMNAGHFDFVHKWLADQRRRRGWGRREDDRFPRGTRDLGNGHIQMANLDMRRANFRPPDKPYWQEYVDLMEKAYGKERAFHIYSVNSDPHCHIWPNVQLVDLQIRILRPISVGETEVWQYAALLKGVPPELNQDRLRSFQSFYSPAGNGSPDDYEIFERCQIGLQGDIVPGDHVPWVPYGRHLKDDWVNEEEGTIDGFSNSEITQRGQYRRWKREMMQP